MAEAGCEVNLFDRLCLLNFFLNHSFNHGALDRFYDVARAPPVVWIAPASPARTCKLLANVARQKRNTGQNGATAAKDLTINHQVLVLEIRGLLMRCSVGSG
jgi:hypothetical protein